MRENNDNCVELSACVVQVKICPEAVSLRPKTAYTLGLSLHHLSPVLLLLLGNAFESSSLEKKATSKVRAIYFIRCPQFTLIETKQQVAREKFIQ